MVSMTSAVASDSALGLLLVLADDLLDLLPYGLRVYPERLQCLCRHTLTLTDETEQNVLGTDAVVLQHPGLLLGQDENPSRAFDEPLEHSLTEAVETQQRAPGS